MNSKKLIKRKGRLETFFCYIRGKKGKYQQLETTIPSIICRKLKLKFGDIIHFSESQYYEDVVEIRKINNTKK